jgi:hypothetical protein
LQSPRRPVISLLCLFLVWFLKQGLTVHPRLAWNSRSSCPSLPNAGVTGVAATPGLLGICPGFRPASLLGCWFLLSAQEAQVTSLHQRTGPPAWALGGSVFTGPPGHWWTQLGHHTLQSPGWPFGALTPAVPEPRDVQVLVRCSASSACVVSLTVAQRPLSCPHPVHCPARRLHLCLLSLCHISSAHPRGCPWVGDPQPYPGSSRSRKPHSTRAWPAYCPGLALHLTPPRVPPPRRPAQDQDRPGPRSGR